MHMWVRSVADGLDRTYLQAQFSQPVYMIDVSSNQFNVDISHPLIANRLRAETPVAPVSTCTATAQHRDHTSESISTQRSGSPESRV